MDLTWEQADKVSSGGGAFFKIQDGETVNVRFLYNTMEDIKIKAVHSVNGSNGGFATIECSREPGEPMESCKWCAQGNRMQAKVIIPIFNEDAGEVQYWTRSSTFVKDNLLPVFSEIPQGQPISGQPFKIKRTGTKMQDTNYNIMASIGTTNDGKTKDQFGEVKDPKELNIIRPNDYEFPAASASNNQQGNGFTSTRRTTDVF